MKGFLLRVAQSVGVATSSWRSVMIYPIRISLTRCCGLILVFLNATGLCFANTWYVDRALTASANDGKSWSTAWTNLDRINWRAIRPGDVIEIAKGDYSEQSRLAIGSSGTSNAPIVIRLASDPLHKGPVKLSGINFSRRNWVTINGALDDSFAVPAAVSSLAQITNNIGIRVHSSGTGIYSSSANTGVRLLWIEVYKCGKVGPRNCDGIYLRSGQHQCEIGYCWLLDNVYGDGITYVQNDDPGWGQLKIHDCLVDNIGDDALHIAAGTDVYRCVIEHRTYGLAHGHTDCFQTWNSYYRIHHNIIRNFACPPGGSRYNSISYAQFSRPVSGNFLFYDNLVYDDSRKWLGAPGLELTFDAWWSPHKHNTLVVITNIFIANNLFCKPDAQNVGWVLHGRSDRYRGTNDAYTIVNCLVANNIFLDGYRMKSAQLQGVAVGLPGPKMTNPAVHVTTQSLPLLNNILAGPNYRIAYMGRIYDNIEQCGKAVGLPENWTRAPSFVSFELFKPPYDFRLDRRDTAARGRGYDLSRYTNSIPMLNVDLDGHVRHSWDIGPYAFVPGAGKQANGDSR